MKQFTTAAKRGTAAVSNPVDITFEYEVREGEFVEMTAHPPTTGQLALFMSHGASGGVRSVQVLFEFLSTVLNDYSYAIIEDQLRDGLDIAVVSEMVQYLTGEWGARPTKSSPSSASSRRTNGRRSTVKPPSRV